VSELCELEFGERASQTVRELKTFSIISITVGDRAESPIWTVCCVHGEESCDFSIHRVKSFPVVDRGAIIFCPS
jgi:hypothetical protein